MFLKFLASATFDLIKMESHVYQSFLPDSEVLGNSMVLYASSICLWLVVYLSLLYLFGSTGCHLRLVKNYLPYSASHCGSFFGAWRAYD